jgi:hypothetical protein
MTSLVPIDSPTVPELAAAAGARCSMRFLEFFAANLCNPHTRRAYASAPMAWCASAGVPSIGAVQPVPGFAIATAPASNRLGQRGKPGYQSRFESTTGPLETFVTLAAIQRLART